MRRITILMVLLTVLVGMLLPAGTSAQSSCPAGFIQTTVGAEGVPNLFRLGLKYGVSWTRIILPSGARPVPERIFPNTVVCVPTGGTTTVVVIINAPGPAPASAPATPVPAPAAFDPVAAYCQGVPVQGVPDRGSCLMEAQAIASGAQRIVQTGIVCAQRVVSNLNGIPVQCNVFGNAWLSVSLPGAVVAGATQPARVFRIVAYNGVGVSSWGVGWGYVTFACTLNNLQGFALRLDEFFPTGVVPAKVTFFQQINASPGWSEGEARGDAQSRGLTEFDPAACP